ncbi:hypothetical protein HKD37_09G024938 [Glycine soja]
MEIMDEDQKNLNDMAKVMMMVNRKSTDMFNTIHIKDQSYGGISRSFVIHSVKYDQDLQNSTIVVSWIELRDYYGLTSNHQLTMIHFGSSVFLLTIYKSTSQPQAYPKWHSLYHQNLNSITFRVLLNQQKVTCSNLDVSSTMYSFMKDAKFTHVNSEGIIECKIVYNHGRKTAKIGSGWKSFASSQNLEVAQEIIFEFLDPKSNFVIFYISLGKASAATVL